MTAATITIAALRAEKGLTLQDFATAIGLKSRGHAKRIQEGERCSPRVAVAIECLSGGRIPAGTLSDEVALARGEAPLTVALCSFCELPAGDPVVLSCTDAQCPMRQSAAA